MLKKVFRIVLTFCGMLLGYGVSTYLVENWDVLSGLLAGEQTLIVVVATALFGLIFFYVFTALSRKGQTVANNVVTELSEKLSTEDLIPIVVGLIAGLLIAYLISPIINGIQALQVFNLNVILTVLLYIAFGTLGVAVAKRFAPDIRLPFLGQNAAKDQQSSKRKNKSRAGAAPKILDTSVIIDGRIVDILKTGFIEGDIVIPTFVLVELRHIADSSDSLKRNRGRRGLDILNKIQSEYGIEIYDTSSDKSLDDIPEVDVKLLKLAQTMKGVVVTNDFNLNKVAAIQGVPVLNINELANTLKPVVLPGETLKVFLVKEGKENSQALAYLDDGTMIVVENGKKLIGQTVSTTVTSVLQTSAGRMIFAKPN
ncbi:MAG: PIN domain nuclease [Firmicutes bacterium]|nr:PIN domain nuclease [Bacillota bacterium]